MQSDLPQARELQEINYPILWGGHLARPVYRAGETPTPQELIGYFFIWKSPIAFFMRSLRVACFFAGVRAADAKGKKKCLTELYALWGTGWSWGTSWS